MIYIRLRTRNQGVGRPEFRVPLMVPGTVLAIIGIFIYSWAGQSHLYWIVSNIGNAFFMAGCVICSQSILTYTVDAYTRFAASALSTLNLVRSIAGFAFPLFAPYIYSRLGLGWGGSVLGLIITFVGFAAPIVLWIFGAALRARSTFAAGD